jgi:hypothetical protein
MRTCPECGSTYHPNTVFCEECGAQLPTHAVSDAGIGRSTSSSGVSGRVMEGLGGDMLSTQAGPPPMILFLEVLSTKRLVELHPVGASPTLGRSDAATASIPTVDLSEDGGAEAGVSRRHARLLWQDGSWWLDDLNSANGTQLNDQRVTPGQPVSLNHGDVIQLGRLFLRVRLAASV